MKDRDMWETPKELWEGLNKQYIFNFDCCANGFNKKCSKWACNFESIKDAQWWCCWMNPPFSKAYKMFEHFFNVVKCGVAIYRCDNMETKVWQDIILKNASWILIPKGRIKYEGFEGTGSRFPSAIIGYNVDVPEYLEGVILKVDDW